MGDTQGPTGLAKSLDELIAEQRLQKKNTRRKPAAKSGVAKRGNNDAQNSRRGQRSDRMVTEKVFRIRGSGSQKHRREGHERRQGQYRNRSPERRRRDDDSSGRRGGRGEGSSYGRRGRGRGRGRGQPYMNFGSTYYGMFDGQGMHYDETGGDVIPEEIFSRIKYSWNGQGVLGVGFDEQEVAQISPTGDVYIRLPSPQFEGDASAVVDAINHIMSPINVKVIAKGANEFQISDGSSLVRYHDGIVVHGKGQIGRASMVMQHLQSQKRGGHSMSMQS